MSANDLVWFVVREQEILWDDLDRAIRNAANGAWSIQAASTAARIVTAARLVGATPCNKVPYRLLSGGVYAAVLYAGEVEFTTPTEVEWQRLDQLMADHGGTREQNLPRLAATRDYIRRPGETTDIRAGVL